MKKLITATALFLALATASGAVPYNAADNAFSAYAVGPGLNNLSIKDDKASYQWALKNDGQAQKIVQELDIDSLDPAYVHRSEEHTSELQSPVPISYAVFCLKKKKTKKKKTTKHTNKIS